MRTKRSILVRLLLMPVKLILMLCAILFMLTTLLIGEEQMGMDFIDWITEFGVYKGDTL